jgi:hypothetical protein
MKIEPKLFYFSMDNGKGKPNIVSGSGNENGMTIFKEHAWNRLI